MLSNRAATTRGRPRKSPPPFVNGADASGETHRQRSVRIATSRLSVVSKGMDLIARLGNKVSYEFDDDERAEIERAVNDAARKAIYGLRHGGRAGAAITFKSED